MRARLLSVAALALLFGVGALAVPTCTLACSCVEEQPLAEYMRDGQNAVFLGRAGPRTGDALAFAVERWFAGPGEASLIALVPGDSSMCGLEVEPGAHMVLVATRGEDGRFTPSICLPRGRVETPEGARLIEQARAIYGEGSAPATARPPIEERPPSAGGRGPEPWLLMAAAAAGLVALGAGLAIAARRRTGG